MIRIPLLPTLLVALAALAMIGLGIWQLDRRAWKEALVARYTRNQTLPPVAFPRFPIGDALLYRRTAAFCLQPVDWRTEGAGSHGWRVIAACRTGAEGPGFSVELGTTHDPKVRPQWQGGRVTGVIVAAPSHTSLIAGLFHPAPQPLMIVADAPPAAVSPRLSPSPRPDVAAIPNNHLAYAVQWFIFAGLAVAIYAIALRRRLKSAG